MYRIISIAKFTAYKTYMYRGTFIKTYKNVKKVDIINFSFVI